MATYSRENFEQIAVAIGKDVADVMQHEKGFEAAALWYRQDCRAPKAPSRVAPFNMSICLREEEMSYIKTRPLTLSAFAICHDRRLEQLAQLQIKAVASPRNQAGHAPSLQQTASVSSRRTKALRLSMEGLVSFVMTCQPTSFYVCWNNTPAPSPYCRWGPS
jgi:hypothetical protein